MLVSSPPRLSMSCVCVYQNTTIGFVVVCCTFYHLVNNRSFIITTSFSTGTGEKKKKKEKGKRKRKKAINGGSKKAMTESRTEGYKINTKKDLK